MLYIVVNVLFVFRYFTKWNSQCCFSFRFGHIENETVKQLRRDCHCNLVAVFRPKAFSSATDFESADHDGKWAEEESEASSVDEFDSISNKGSRREEFEARKALALEERKSQQQAEQVDSVEERLTKSASDVENKKALAAKAKTSTSAKGGKKGKIRFKEGGKTLESQKTGKDGKKMAKKGKEVEKEEKEANNENASDVSEPKEEKRNKYLDEWLGIKREEEDTRYKPGKPPPNRSVRQRIISELYVRAKEKRP